MLRGVNKRVVEILNTENEYIERAILFVRNDKLQTEAEVLDYQVQLYLRGLGTAAPKVKRARLHSRALILALKLTGAAAIGAALAGLILSIN